MFAYTGAAKVQKSSDTRNTWRLCRDTRHDSDVPFLIDAHNELPLQLKKNSLVIILILVIFPVHMIGKIKLMQGC